MYSVTVVDRNDPMFEGVQQSFNAGLYHSWIVERKSLPDCLKVTCIDESDYIMGIRHKEFDICGVQFHPESVMTEFGFDIIRNWIEM